MRVLGVIGGVASGKSRVARQFADLGGGVILDGDQEGHEVLQEPEVITAARDRWGESVVDYRGRLHRGAIAARVFAATPEGSEELRFWQSVTHPRIHARLREALTRYRQQGQVPLVVLDAAVMLETGWDRECDTIVFVEATEEVRRARARGRGWSEDDWRGRESRQLPLAEKRARADFVIDNSGSIDQTYEQVVRVFQSLSLTPSSPPPASLRDPPDS